MDKINIEDNLTESIEGYGLTLNDERKWWQPAFQILSLTHVHAGETCMGTREDHVSWHWTFRKARTRLNALHAELVTETMKHAWAKVYAKDPDAPPAGFEPGGYL